MVLLLLLPVTLLLFLIGFLGFIYARNSMLDQWKEAAILKLQRAAHHMDMKLSQSITWIEMFQETADEHQVIGLQEWLVERLNEIDGVTNVQLNWTKERPLQAPMHTGRMQMRGQGRMRFHRGSIAEITPPVFDSKEGEETVSLIFDLEDENGQTVGQLLVTILFEYLMADIEKMGWWQSDAACLIDNKGAYLAHTAVMMKGRSRLGDTEDPLESAILEEMRTKPFGTLLGSGHPPDRVAGFYKLENAPWTMVIYAPGDEILAPIVKFRSYYIAGGTLFILIILLLIRFVVGKVVRSITEISRMAGRVAEGNYDNVLRIESRDEIGHLSKSFNTMIQGLRERDFIRNTFGRYVDQEIAKELLTRPEAARLGGDKREVAILMSDIRGFTSLSESLSPEATISILNHYFSHLVEMTKKHKGIIVDFFGDGVLVFFDPFKDPIEPVVQRAVDCAFEIQDTMVEFNEEMRDEGFPELQTGIGINVGEVVVGNIGSETRAKYGIVGSPVNITNRIQSTANAGDVVISESTYRYVSESIKVKRSFEASLKGVQERANLYAVEAAE